MLGLCALASAANIAESSFAACPAPAFISGAVKKTLVNFGKFVDFRQFTIEEDCGLWWSCPPPHQRHIFAPDYCHNDILRKKTLEGSYKNAVCKATDLYHELGIPGDSWEQQLKAINESYSAARQGNVQNEPAACLAAGATGVGSWLVDSGSC